MDLWRLTCLYAEAAAETAECCPQEALVFRFHFLAVLRADEGDSLKVYDLVRGEVVELTGHPDHVMCGSMS